MAQPSFAVRPRGHPNQFKGSKTGPRPPPRQRVESNVMVMPLARGLAVLECFGTEQVWMSNKQIALETGLPVPTVSRLLHSLVTLGYVRYDATQRKYRLAAAALGLGYAATADGAIRRAAGEEMRKFAESTDTYVTLGTRDQLDVIVVDSYLGSQAMLALDLTPGTRMSIVASLAGAALLSALPEQERSYLQGALEHKVGREWPAQRRRIAEKISQIRELGFCMSPGEWVPELSSISTPIYIRKRPPWVLSCTGRTAYMSRIRMERELGPRLVLTAQLLQERMAVVLS
ncbi:IclR family transcriptional regulator [Pseudorhodoferax sp.]|uniref:IclR family transcriptional regulator n=1 Tax=Pseudorhodoferax sp. TaxID=1993553 RepID=UPI0039E36D72